MTRKYKNSRYIGTTFSRDLEKGCLLIVYGNGVYFNNNQKGEGSLEGYQSICKNGNYSLYHYIIIQIEKLRYDKYS